MLNEVVRCVELRDVLIRGFTALFFDELTGATRQQQAANRVCLRTCQQEKKPRAASDGKQAGALYAFGLAEK
jgi:hypothetical protein